MRLLGWSHAAYLCLSYILLLSLTLVRPAGVDSSFPFLSFNAALSSCTVVIIFKTLSVCFSIISPMLSYLVFPLI